MRSRNESSALTSVNVQQKRLRKDAIRNRQRIIVAAQELFASQGLEATLNDVAHHAGVGVGTVYRRFATKDELLEASFGDSIDRLAHSAKIALSEGNSWNGFVRFVETLCEMTATDRGLREILFSSAFGDLRVGSSRQELANHMSMVVQRARSDGHIRPDIGYTDVPILGMLAGTVSEYSEHIQPDLWRRYIRLLLDGMRCRESENPVASEPF